LLLFLLLLLFPQAVNDDLIGNGLEYDADKDNEPSELVLDGWFSVTGTFRDTNGWKVDGIIWNFYVNECDDSEHVSSNRSVLDWS